MSEFVCVYAFRTWRPLQQGFQIASVSGTREGISLIEGAEVIPGSGHEVPLFCLDRDGFVSRLNGPAADQAAHLEGVRVV